MITSINEYVNKNYVYHVGDLKHKTDFIGDKLYHIKQYNYLKNSKTGHFGAGYYFFSNLDDAIEYKKIANRKIVMIDFSLYNTYKPNKVEEFVESVIHLTDHLMSINKEYLETIEFADFIDNLTADLNYFDININVKDTFDITKKFIEDLINLNNPKSDYIITRYLKHLGYEGIDFRNTKYDNFYIGNVLYDIKSEIITTNY